MPAGRGNLCERCYWTSTCRKRVQIDLAAFATPVMRDDFDQFGRWLEGKVGAHKAALTIHRYLPFFLQMEAKWTRIPPYAKLLDHFAAEGLRRVRLPMQWLREARGVEPDPIARQNDSERRRIQALVNALPAGYGPAHVLTDYHNTLMARHEAGRTSLHSVRLALRPAVSLLQAAHQQDQKLPDQPALDRYLLEAPGQKAAVTGFIRFLQANHGVELVIRTDSKKTRVARRRKLERMIIHMSEHPEDGEEFMHRWISAGLEYFHGIKVSVKAVMGATVIKDDDGLRVEINRQSYFLPR